MKKVSILFVLVASATWVSCGGGGSSTPQRVQTFLAKRAFITNSSTTNGAAVVSIIDATKDLFGNHAMNVPPGSNVIATTIPGKVSVVSSKTTAQVAIIDNTLEGVRSSIPLPAETESMAVTPDGRFAFAAVHNTNSIEILDLSNGVLCTTLTTTCRGPITVNAPTKIVLSGDGKRMLAFSDNPVIADSVYVINAEHAVRTTGLTLPDDLALVPGFDKAVDGVFAGDNSTAYIMNCGLECAGTTAGVRTLNTTTTPPAPISALVPVGGGATVGLLDNGTLYVAGTPPPTPPGNPVVLNAGVITKLNATTLATVGTPKNLPPGYHDTIAIQAGKVFVGSRACTVTSGSNQSCLGIFDGTNTTISSTYDGDVTGMQAISGRTVVYVIMGGELRIYDANTSAPQSQQLDIVGHAEQVVLVDP